MSAVVIENLGKRKGEMRQMVQSQGNTRLEFLVPSRGLIGFRSEFMTQTRAPVLCIIFFHGYEPFKGNYLHRTRGALIVMEDGESVAYGMWKLQERSTFFIDWCSSFAGMIGEIPASTIW